MHQALTYLAVRSIRNGIAFRLRRLRQPRYLVIALGGSLYFAMMILNRQHLGGFTIPPDSEWIARMALAALIVTAMAFTWLISGTAALRFSLADTQFLFPAPVPRRALLAYKIVRLMLGAATAPVFVTLVAGPVHPLPALVFYVKAAAIAAFIAVHEAAVSLYRLNATEAGGLTAGRKAAVFAAGVGVVAASTWLLTHFAFSGTREFLSLVPLVAIAIAVQAAWILRSDAAFEESAMIAAEKAAKARAAAQRVQPARVAVTRTPFRLAPRGPAETAILWKNWMLLSRTSARQWMLTAALALPVVLGVGAFALSDGAPVGAVIGFVLMGASMFFGPVALRIDLRQDLGNLVLIKTWPVRGPAIVRGEVLAPAIALSSVAALGALIVAASAPASMLPSTAGGVIGRMDFFVVATLVATATIVTQLVFQNGVAALFPAWVRIAPGAGQPGGVEIMGQGMVVMYGGMLALLIAAIVPAAAAVLIWFLAGGTLIPAAVFAVLLSFESYAATEVVGRILDRVDLREIAINE